MVTIDIVISKMDKIAERIAMTPDSVRLTLVQHMTPNEIESLFMFLSTYAENDNQPEIDGKGIDLGGLDAPSRNQLLTVLSLVLSPGD